MCEVWVEKKLNFPDVIPCRVSDWLPVRIVIRVTFSLANQTQDILVLVGMWFAVWSQVTHERHVTLCNGNRVSSVKLDIATELRFD